MFKSGQYSSYLCNIKDRHDQISLRNLGCPLCSMDFTPSDSYKRCDLLKSTPLLYKIGHLIRINTHLNTCYTFTQILTEEDEESAIMSFSSGTVLGESSIILPSTCTANVRCATYCELHSLSLPGLAKVLLGFPEKVKYVIIRSEVSILRLAFNLLKPSTSIVKFTTDPYY